MDVLQRELPEWRSVDIHESSPSDGALQARLSEARYVATQYHPDAARGEVVAGYRNENLEAQTFGDESFDVVLTLDVLEHVNRPERVFAEVARTLRPSGRFIFTVPTYPSLQYTARVGEYDSDGRIHFLGESEFHDNPVDPAGAAVTFRYGYDLPALIFDWTGMETTVTRGQRLSIGVFGDMTEVYVSHKVDAY